jgi:hypothetical protein
MDRSSQDTQAHAERKLHVQVELFVGVTICVIAGVVFFYGYFSYDGFLYVLVAFIATLIGLRLIYDARNKLDELNSSAGY